jgi:hypothetical protein
MLTASNGKRRRVRRRGCTKTVMLAHIFTVAQLAELVREERQSQNRLPSSLAHGFVAEHLAELARIGICGPDDGAIVGRGQMTLQTADAYDSR